jgi:hypothetical protein
MLLNPFVPSRRAGARLVGDLPAYQVAFWPDGWEVLPDGQVLLRDTHAVAEARRWYALADRNGARESAPRTMAVHGVFVPRAIVDLAGRRFPREAVASVAVQLVAGEWIRERRRQLLAAPTAALAERALAWCGSRHRPGMDEAGVRLLIERLLALCIGERLLPDVDYSLAVRPADGYGIRCYFCSVRVRLESYACKRVQDVLDAAMIPWNRAVVRHGTAAKIISLEVRSGRPRGGYGERWCLAGRDAGPGPEPSSA